MRFDLAPLESFGLRLKVSVMPLTLEAVPGGGRITGLEPVLLRVNGQ